MARRFKLDNRTYLRGDDLRRLVCAASRVAPACRLTEIAFFQSPDFHSFGYAYCEEDRIEIYVARGVCGTRDDLREISQLVFHELHHLAGLDHKDYDEGFWWQVPVTWSEGLKLRCRKRRGPHPLEVKIRRLVDRLAGQEEAA